MTDNRQDTLKLPPAKPLDEAAIREFSSNVRGQLIRSENAAYDEARRVFHGSLGTVSPWPCCCSRQQAPLFLSSAR
jgi:hypothetical protein